MSHSPFDHFLELSEHDGKGDVTDEHRDWLGADWGLAPLSAFLGATWNNGRQAAGKLRYLCAADRFTCGRWSAMQGWLHQV